MKNRRIINGVIGWGGESRQLKWSGLSKRGERVVDLVEEVKGRTWSEEAEHAVLKLDTGERLMVRGGRDSISFTVQNRGITRTLYMRYNRRSVRVERIYGDTHPRVTGPSDSDL